MKGRLGLGLRFNRSHRGLFAFPIEGNAVNRRNKAVTSACLSLDITRLVGGVF